jgi:hypothetical protein
MDICLIDHATLMNLRKMTAPELKELLGRLNAEPEKSEIPTEIVIPPTPLDEFDF